MEKRKNASARPDAPGLFSAAGSDPTHLVHVVVVDDAVEAFVDVVEHVHHLHRGAVLAQGGETHDVTEIDGHLLVQLWLHHAALLQALHHGPEERKHVQLMVRRLPVHYKMEGDRGSSMKFRQSALSLSALYRAVLSSTRCSRFLEYIWSRRIMLSK